MHIFILPRDATQSTVLSTTSCPSVRLSVRDVQVS